MSLVRSIAAVARRCTLGAAVAVAGFPAAASSDIVISQFYAWGGETGAAFRHDYVELFNRGATPVDVAGWSVQYRIPPTLEWFKIADLSGTIAPGGYYLVQLPGAAAGSGADLPPPEATGTGGLALNRGSLVLFTLSPTQISCGPSEAAFTADRVSYGTTVCPEGNAMATPADHLAALRDDAGCTDTDDNLADFTTGPPAPRHGASSPNACAVLGASPATGSARLGPVRPNPSASGTEVAFTLARDGPVRLGVFDLRGRRLRRLVDGWRPAGDHRASWDGTREDGGVAPAGVYFARFEAPGERVHDTRRFVRVR